MRFLRLELRRSGASEIIDQGNHDPTILASNLADIRRINRWLGGYQLTIGVLESALADLKHGTDVSILDVGTGSADLADALHGWDQHRRLKIQLVASDVSEQIIGIARHQAAPATIFAVADAQMLPFASQSFDVATCSLVLHHLSPEAAVAVLHEMSRVARRGIIVNDLVRSRRNYWAAWLLCHLVFSNPFTQNDGPLSVCRSYTCDEISGLLAQANLIPIQLHGFLGYRVAIYARRQHVV